MQKNEKMFILLMSLGNFKMYIPMQDDAKALVQFRAKM